MRKPVFLTANGLYKQEILSAFLNMIDSSTSHRTICIVTTADKEYKSKNYHAVNLYNTFTEMKYSVDFIDLEFDCPYLLYNYDTIYINGGNPFYLLYHIKNSGSDQLLRELQYSKFIAGQSAGAAVLGRSLEHAQILHPEWNDLNLADLSGIGIVDEVILPHSNRYTEVPESIHTLKPIMIEDNQYKIFQYINKDNNST